MSQIDEQMQLFVAMFPNFIPGAIPWLKAHLLTFGSLENTIDRYMSGNLMEDVRGTENDPDRIAGLKLSMHKSIAHEQRHRGNRGPEKDGKHGSRGDAALREYESCEDEGASTEEGGRMNGGGDDDDEDEDEDEDEDVYEDIAPVQDDMTEEEWTRFVEQQKKIEASIHGSLAPIRPMQRLGNPSKKPKTQYVPEDKGSPTASPAPRPANRDVTLSPSFKGRPADSVKHFSCRLGAPAGFNSSQQSTEAQDDSDATAAKRRRVVEENTSSSVENALNRKRNRQALLDDDDDNVGDATPLQRC
eukprot:ANDGO_00677.mRNA.1 hypothetical protein